MIGNVIALYLVYVVATSWIFWMIMGGLLFLVGFTVSPLFRVIVVLILSLAFIMIWRG